MAPRCSAVRNVSDGYRPQALSPLIPQTFGHGNLPLQFSINTNAQAYGLDSAECDSSAPVVLNQKTMVIQLKRGNGNTLSLPALVRIDTLYKFALDPKADILHYLQPYLQRRLTNDGHLAAHQRWSLGCSLGSTTDHTT